MGPLVISGCLSSDHSALWALVRSVQPAAWGTGAELGLLGLLALFWLGGHLQARHAWRRAARVLGIGGTAPGPYHLAGKVHGHRVQVESMLYVLRNPMQLRRTRILVHLEAVPKDLLMVREGLWSALSSGLVSPKLHTGDTDFDKRIWLGGDEAQILARLDAKARRLVMEMVGERGVRVQRREMVFESRGLMRRAEKIAQLVRSMAALAERLDLGEQTVAGRLLRNVRAEAEAGVRDRNLRALLRRYPESWEARIVAEKAVSHSDPEIRLLGALQLGEAGYATVEALLLDDDVPDAVHLKALDAVSRWPDTERARSVVDRLLEAPLSRLHPAAVRLAGQLGHGQAIERLAERSLGAPPEVVQAIALALAQLDGFRSEPLLIALLPHPERAVRVAAVEGLAEVGSIAAVEPLLALTRGLLSDSGLKAAARQAISAIQGRLGDADVGRLSLTELDSREGQLSLTPETGHLALAEEEEEDEVGR